MMAGLAALPAAVPAVAAAASAVGTDAELIALGKKHETLVDAYYVARQPWALALSERNSALEERFGAPADRGYRDPPEYEAAAKEIDARLGLDAAADQLHTVFEKIEPIALAIEALPCTSIEGLRAKALVAFWEVAPPTTPNFTSRMHGRSGNCSLRSLRFAGSTARSRRRGSICRARAATTRRKRDGEA
jgi:hypothetical protein